MNTIKEDYKKIISFYKTKKVLAIVLGILIIICLIFVLKQSLFFFVIGYSIRLWVKRDKKKNNEDIKSYCPHCKEEVRGDATRCPHCHGKIYIWTKGRKILVGFLIASTALFIITASLSTTTNNQVATNSYNSAPKLIPSETDRKQIENLKKNFDYKYDEFEKKGWYTSKNQTVENSWNRNYLKVNVNSEGYEYLESNYYGTDWIFHTRVEVKIGDNIYKTDDVSTLSKDNSRNNSGGSVWESVSYTSDKDNGIIKAIAESGDAPIKVRFTGGESVKDITLSKKDQQAIKDSYELSQLIKKFGNQ